MKIKNSFSSRKEANQYLIKRGWNLNKTSNTFTHSLNHKMRLRYVFKDKRDGKFKICAFGFGVDK